MLADDDGAWIVWTDPSYWHRTVWRLDASGMPVHPPRHLATLYFMPATRLVTTELGPSLVWSTSIEEGVVPLCRAAELDEPPRSDGHRGAGITIPSASAQ